MAAPSDRQAKDKKRTEKGAQRENFDRIKKDPFQHGVTPCLVESGARSSQRRLANQQ